MATIFSLPENFLAKADVKWEEYRAFGIPNIGTRFVNTYFKQSIKTFHTFYFHNTKSIVINGFTYLISFWKYLDLGLWKMFMKLWSFGLCS